MKKVLITGGAGFIGSHIVEACVRRGDAVRILDDFSSGKKDNLRAVADQVEMIEGDVCDRKAVERAVAGMDVVFHEAALRSVPRSVDDPQSTSAVNIEGTLNILVAARDARVRRVVYASSSSAYGNTKTFPQHEGLPCAPLSPYAVAKLTGELYCQVFARTYGLETVALRYFNVYGPRQHPESRYAAVIPQFMQALLHGTSVDIHADGRQSRDFTYIENVVQANLLAADADVSGQVFNIALGETHSLLEMVRILEKLAHRPLKRRHAPARAGDVRKTFADIRLAKKKLRYRPSVNFEEGLRRTWEWFKETQGKAQPTPATVTS